MITVSESGKPINLGEHQQPHLAQFYALSEAEKIHWLAHTNTDEVVDLLSYCPLGYVQYWIVKMEKYGFDKAASHLSFQLGFVHSEAEPADDYLSTGVLEHVKQRVGWIVLLAIFGIFSGFIIASYEDLLSQLVLLAIYMPVIAAAGGNTGSQAATLVVRALATGEIKNRQWRAVLWKESRVALLLAGILALVIVGRIALFTPAASSEGFGLSLIATAVAIALFIQVTISTVLGGLLPIVARALKLDPAILVSPVLASLVDISGIWIYFNIVNFILF
ncbi:MULTISPECIES: magnesium transporter [Vibrio]|uniref:magnesium transporter n=1 Tax=Vibrio TaxID=662 RepID=UPI0001BDF483|nr:MULTISPECIES: magnesium transporter [Vibrio]EEZ88485.1 conserved hypothetical protein [Vibrio harveyi 1DA3]CAK6713515.1 conserved membrane hypothetical protein [Vibrio harveyi]